MSDYWKLLVKTWNYLGEMVILHYLFTGAKSDFISEYRRCTGRSRVRKRQQASTLQLEYRSNDLVSCGPMAGEEQSLYTD